MSTHAPVCTLNNDFVDCNTPGVTYHCSTGFSVSAGQCIRTTAATPSCPAGYQSGAFGICYRYTAARSSCPADYDPPSQGICYKRTPAANPCQDGYTHANGQCTRTTAARSNCPADYDPPSQGICYKRTPADIACPSGYTHANGQCTRTTAARSNCPADYAPPSQGICYKRTPADIACATGIPRGSKCVTAAPAALTHTCPGGVAPNNANQCVTSPPAAITCDGKKTTDATCAHTHTPPTISDLAPSGTSTAGQTYSDPFTVTPATAAVEASGTGCAVSGSFGSYTLTATSAHTTPQTVPITCTVTATADNLTATATAAISFGPAEHTIRPTLPRNLRCAAATETTATWKWQAADRAHSYWYRYSSLDAWTRVGDANARSHTRTGITPTTRNGGWGNIRYFTLIARNNIGDSSHKNAVCVTLPPNWLTAECSATGEITAKWSKPLGLNNTTPVNYTATAATEPPSVLGTDTLTPYNGKATTSTHTGKPGTTYTIRVQTQPIPNKPTYSETTTIECEATVPAPSDLECTQDLSDNMAPYETKCRWNAVTSPATSEYQLQTRRQKSDGTWTVPVSVTVTATSVVRSLVVGTYQARAQANLPREGEWSDWTEPFDVVAPSRPAAPIGNCASSTSGLESTITWTWNSAGPQAEYDITYTDPAEHPTGQSLWQDAGSRTTEGPVTGLTPSVRYSLYVRAKNKVGASASTEIGCDTPAPNGASQYAEVQKIARLGDVEGGYTLQQFKDEKNPQDPTNPTIAPYPYLNWADDDCSIPQGAIIQTITGWGNEFTPKAPVNGIPTAIPGAPKAPLREGCWRHDFAWRNLYRIEQKYSVDSWNQANFDLSNARLKADWHDICATTYYEGGWSFFGFEIKVWAGFGLVCQRASTLASIALSAGASVGDYSTNIEQVGYVQQ